ncbi:MAG: hypothetical protein KatS3mg060_1299 [Dehalococcoidia bacterium]|nr:MAG: hypothetical protein KatS3mg060_1299 [Dehalococcoidia bacterium]
MPHAIPNRRANGIVNVPTPKATPATIQIGNEGWNGDHGFKTRVPARAA